jgi:hypothetical protein
VKPGAVPAEDEPEMTWNNPWSRERVESGGHAQVSLGASDSLPVHADAPLSPIADYGMGRVPICATGSPFVLCPGCRRRCLSRKSRRATRS